MRPAKEFPAAREHFGETKQATLEFFFSRLIFAMRYQKRIPRLNHARITQDKPFICFRILQFFHCYVIIITQLVVRSSFSIVQYTQGCHIFTAQKEERFLEDYHVHRCQIFRPKSSEEQKKKRSSRPHAVV